MCQKLYTKNDIIKTRVFQLFKHGITTGENFMWNLIFPFFYLILRNEWNEKSFTAIFEIHLLENVQVKFQTQKKLK